MSEDNLDRVYDRLDAQEARMDRRIEALQARMFQAFITLIFLIVNAIGLLGLWAITEYEGPPVQTIP